MKSFIVSLIIIIGLLSWRIDNVTTDRDAKKKSLADSEAQVSALRSTLEAQREKMQILTALDTKYSQELTYVQSENARLAADIATGKRRLLIKASCPGSPRLPEATGTTSVDDGSTAELNHVARQDYYTLRRQLTKTDKALAGLQAYVSEVCRP